MAELQEYGEPSPENIAELANQIFALILGFLSSEAIDSIAAVLIRIIVQQAGSQGEAHLAISEISDLLHRSITHHFEGNTEATREDV